MPDTNDSAHTRNGLVRSTHWPAVRNAVLESQLTAWRKKFKDFDEYHQGVEWEVHHRIPFHFGVLLGLGYIELDVRNLYVAPRHAADLHLLVCHLDDFHSYNLDVLKDLKRWGGELWGGEGRLTPDHDGIRAAIFEDKEWQQKHLHRPRQWGDMTDREKEILAKLILRELPLAHHEPKE